MITLEGLPEDVAAEEQALIAALRRAGAPKAGHDAQTTSSRWTKFLGSATAAQGLMRVGVPAQHLLACWRLVGAAACGGCELVLRRSRRAGLCCGNTRAPANRRLGHSRAPAALALGGYGVLMLAPPGLTAPEGRWGYRPDTLALMQRLKEQWIRREF